MPKNKTINVFIIALIMFWMGVIPIRAEVSIKETEFRDARKECAMCHYYWMETFLSGEGTDYVPMPKERQATTERMCFSCHNGSLGDSRSIVWTNKRHPVGFYPKMDIPGLYPLYKGKVECGTCHTAHGGKTDYSVERSFFLRSTNNNSEMCMGCHKDKKEGPLHGMHPVNVDTLEFSEELKAAGAIEGTKPNMVICQSCHVVHGSPYDHLLALPVSIPGSNRAPLCEGCHTANPSMPGHGPGKDTHPVDVKFKVAVLPESWIGNRKPVTGAGGEITCRTCHQPHSAPGKKLLVEDNSQARLCKRCHLDKKSSGINEENTGTHPVDVGIKNIKPTKRVFVENGKISCNGCHIQHNAVDNSAADGSDGPILRQTNLGGKFCAECHQGKVVSNKARAEAIGTHPVNIVPQTAVIPDYWFDKGAKLGPNCEVVCVSCHKIHGSVPGTSNLLVYNNDTRLCGSCHQKKSAIVKREKPYDIKHPVNIVPTQVQVSDSMLALGAQKGPNGELICNSCHHPHKGTPGTPILLKTNKKNSICFECHADKKSVYLSDHNLFVMGPDERNSLGQTVSEGGICSPCHTAHTWAKPLSGEGDIVSQLCLSCHSGGNLAQNKSVGFYSHPTEKHMPAGDKKTDLPLFNKFGLREKNGLVYCTSCHDPHVWTPGERFSIEGIEKIPWALGTEGDGNNSFLRMKNDADSSLCRECYLDKSYIKNTDHDLRITAPLEKNILGKTAEQSGVCGSCHLPHNGINRRRWAKEVIGRGEDFSSQLCKTCHFEGAAAAKKLVGEYTHPTNISITRVKGKTRLPLFDEQGNLKEKGNVVCYTCHDPHVWNSEKKTSEGPGKETEGDAHNSFLRISNGSESKLCVNCHTSKQYVIGTEHDMSVTSPNEKNTDGMTVQQSGVCSACHKVHRGNARRNWARKIAGGDEDIAAQLCKSCHQEGKVAEKKLLGEYSHPTNVQISSATGKYAEVGRDFPLPLYDEKGNKILEGKVYCYTCHDPHRWDPRKKEIGPKKNTEGDTRNSFLRIPNDKDARLCLTCHLDKRFILGTDHDLNVSSPAGENRFGQTVKSSGICGMCHTVHQGLNDLLWAQELVEAKDTVSQACFSCHSDGRLGAEKQVGESSHPVGINPSWLIGKANLPLKSVLVTKKDYADRITPRMRKECASVCHLMHQDYQDNILTRYFPGKEDYVDQNCLKKGCHLNDAGGDKSKYTHPTDRELVPKKEVYQRKIMVCTTCHDPHRWDPRRPKTGPGKKVEGSGRNSFLRMVNDDNSSLCINCHRPNRTVIGTDHDMKITAPDEKNMLGQTVFDGGPCSACHSVHNAVLDAYLWSKNPGDGQEVTMMLCTSCHRKGGSEAKKVPPVMIHPQHDSNNLDIVVTDLGRGIKNLQNYFRIYDIDGRRSRNGIISCPSCHNAHRWTYLDDRVGIGKNIEGDATNSFLINKNVTTGVCIDCHSMDAVYRYKYYHVPRMREKVTDWQDIQGQY